MARIAPTPASSADVVIVGGGPAGTAAAITAARAGRSVILVDKAEFPRDKCCGDGLTTLALREVEALGLQPAAVTNWQTVTDVVLHAPSGRHVDLTLPATGLYAATTPRRELDDALLQLARSAGVQIFTGARLCAVRHSDDAVHVDLAPAAATANETANAAATAATAANAATHPATVSASSLIAADGMWSATRKALGINEPGYLGEWHAMRQYATATGSAATRLHVWFEPDLLPGYAWSFPLPNGRVNIGFGIRRDGRRPTKEMAGLWTDLLARPHIAETLGDLTLEDRVTAWPIPAAVTRATLTHDRVLFVGDAARATDVMTGEGIGQALLTGRLAAEAVCAGGTPTEIAAKYQHAVRAELFADHRMSAALGRVLGHRRATNAALRIVDLHPWTRRNFARWMFEDEPRALPFSPRRWHRSILRRDGAYRNAP